jgi:hypothetical protein
MSNSDKLTVKAYLSGGEYYAADGSSRLWAGPAKTKTLLRKQIAAFNKKNVNAPKLILK